MGKRPDAAEAIWAEYARGVKPLRGRRRPAAVEPPEPAPKPRPGLRTPPAPTADATPDRRTLENLKRGRMRPAARLDLHGMTRDEAHAALAAFIARAQADGVRVGLVITGRSGILREEVPRWLAAPTLRPRILGHAEAKPRDGGAGAIYVLIRRARP